MRNMEHVNISFSISREDVPSSEEIDFPNSDTNHPNRYSGKNC